MAFVRVQTDDGRVVDVLDGGSQIAMGDSPQDVLAVVIARLRASNKGAPARPKSLAITHCEEAMHWLLALSEGRSS